MLFFNKVLLLNDLPSLFRLLQNQVFQPSFCFYGERIVIKHDVIDKLNSIRIWRTTSLFDYFYEKQPSNRFIGALDYIVQEDGVKIDYVNINDKENVCHYENRLTDIESKELLGSMVQFITSVAKEEQKNKIKLDVHENLRLYNKHFQDLSFVKTERKSIDNPYWVETEINI